jgi:hypothetical protein
MMTATPLMKSLLPTLCPPPQRMHNLKAAPRNPFPLDLIFFPISTLPLTHAYASRTAVNLGKTSVKARYTASLASPVLAPYMPPTYKVLCSARTNSSKRAPCSPQSQNYKHIIACQARVHMSSKHVKGSWHRRAQQAYVRGQTSWAAR